MALTLDRPEEVHRRIADHLAGGEERPALTGLELYYALERATPLLEFHTMLRSGPRNRDANGLQQSYGDHNRLLLLGLDHLLDGDLGWYRTRVVDGEVSDDELLDCFATVAGFGLGPAEQVALWVGAALHDCGMLVGRGADLDVEDGIALAQGLIDELCPADVAGLAAFALRHHDYIKDVFTGSVPVRLVADGLAGVPAHQRVAALGALGMIQVAGAASLGTGRLTAFRMEIFRRCAAGTALDDPAPALRLSRLLQAGETEHASVTTSAEEALAALGTAERGRVGSVLDGVALHGWHRATADLDQAGRVSALVAVAERWAADPVDRIVLDGPQSVANGHAEGRRERTLSGTEVLVLSA